MKRIPPFRIVYEDDALVVVDKAAGIAVIADRWDDSRERLDELLNSCYAADLAAARQATPAAKPRLPFPHRVYVVHRIDRDTSGLVVFAKTADAHRLLSRAFESRSVEKSYLAVVQGRPAWTETSCDLPLLVDGDRAHRTIIDKTEGKPALTHFRLLGSVDTYSVLEARLETGRTHQIRAHLASLGHPIVCDPLYGSPEPVKLSSFKRNRRGDPADEVPLLSRLGLHAVRLVLPVGQEETSTGTGALDLTAPLPRDLGALLKQMEKWSGQPIYPRRP
jgi:23S rRNA pseudouridine1911/1915/1917 synthase